jgi:hypothetical protein
MRVCYVWLRVIYGWLLREVHICVFMYKCACYCMCDYVACCTWCNCLMCNCGSSTLDVFMLPYHVHVKGPNIVKHKDRELR